MADETMDKILEDIKFKLDNNPESKIYLEIDSFVEKPKSSREYYTVFFRGKLDDKSYSIGSSGMASPTMLNNRLMRKTDELYDRCKDIKNASVKKDYSMNKFNPISNIKVYYKKKSIN